MLKHLPKGGVMKKTVLNFFIIGVMFFTCGNVFADMDNDGVLDGLIIAPQYIILTSRIQMETGLAMYATRLTVLQCLMN